MTRLRTLSRRALALYLLAYRKQWDINVACYGLCSAAIVFSLLLMTGVIGPTLDAHSEPIHTASDGGKTAYAAKHP
ncbi:hypothetical protein BBB39_09070 [Bordetella trematum]|uniref:Phage protein n=1 Tax=Bordetella trematum TaxID=123899 RepID=A0A157SNU8_9BORD|nr:hypothetical protein [Bordetella trematum]AZR93904.1 hypothetical protein BBB39_09070 [Bordetella trematum]NNH19033.1 hypothetical protein [Bordetella trematum]SAI42780.1 phage protein [Bordetella trematum]SAI72168.1 phage protein [Bordetella trematum]SUV97952.1 phage protein [Bordetella trematum]